METKEAKQIERTFKPGDSFEVNGKVIRIKAVDGKRVRVEMADSPEIVLDKSRK